MNWYVAREPTKLEATKLAAAGKAGLIPPG
jgi:hypothetical protein